MDAGTIISLLIILLSVAAGVVEKILKNAGKTDNARKVREFSKMFTGEEQETESNTDFPRRENPAPVAPVEQISPVRADVPRSAPKAQTPAVTEYYSGRLTGSQESDSKKSAEKRKNDGKLDPKKLIVYSEIMKPKFSE